MKHYLVELIVRMCELLRIHKAWTKRKRLQWKSRAVRAASITRTAEVKLDIRMGCGQGIETLGKGGRRIVEVKGVAPGHRYYVRTPGKQGIRRRQATEIWLG